MRQCWRVITDEPQGLAVGFTPRGTASGEELTLDGPYTLVLDVPAGDKSDYNQVYFLPLGDGTGVAIFGDGLRLNSGLRGSDGEELWPEPVDLAIWRSQAELDEWLSELESGA